MDNETKIKVSFNNSVTNAKKLDTYAEKLKEIYGILSAIDKGKLAQMGEFNITLSKVKDNTEKIEKGTKNHKKHMQDAFNVGKIVFFGKALGRLARSFGELSKKSSQYVENINLLEVAYANIDKKTGQFNEDIKESSARIEKLIDNMAEVYGFDESRLARSFGIFKQMANAMELPTETAENLSELMVKLSNDVSSLYNIDLSRSENALQSALAGQVRPIRTATGADITEKTLQKTVDALGLERNINQLSYVEKRLIMIISLTEQLNKAQGDYGRTINSVANQTRIMHEQWERLTRAIGNVFYPLIEKVLPYINAILMVLTEIFNMVASLLGFKMPEFDYSNLAGISDETQNIIDGMNEAGSSVDNLKEKLNGLRGFDKLNVITTPKDKYDTSFGVDKKILDAFNKSFEKYDDKMEEIRLKANEIRDSIMHWLGFEEKFDENGNKSWVFKEITPGTIIGALAIGSPFVLGINAILSTFKKIGDTSFFKSLGKSKVVNIMLTIGGVALTFDAVKKELDGDTTWATIFEGIGGSAMLAGGVWNLTHNVKITLLATAISLVPQATVVVKKGWDSLLKDVDQYIGNGDGKTTFEEYWDAWVGGWTDYIIPSAKKLGQDIIDSIFPNKTVDSSGKKGSSSLGYGGSGRKLIDDDFDIFGDLDPFQIGKQFGTKLQEGIESGMQKTESKVKLGADMSPFKDTISKNLSLMSGVASGVLSMFGINSSVIQTIKNLKFYDKGGFLPPVGNLFVMNENEPELLGTIGGKSFVANQSQMMDLLDKKIGNAQKSTGTQVINLYLDADHKIGSYTMEQLQNMAKTDGKPITIGG